MAKTAETVSQERRIYFATQKLGVFGCHEVTIGFGAGGTERVDYMTVDTKGTFRCYEIKVTKADFRSKAAATFVGHFNYYVMPEALFEEVKAEIPAHIGAYDGARLLRPAKRVKLERCEILLLYSMVRSLSRVYQRRMRYSHREALEIAEDKLRQAQEIRRATNLREAEIYWTKSFVRERGLKDDFDRYMDEMVAKYKPEV